MIPATAFPGFRYRVPRDGALFRAGLASSAISKGAPGQPKRRQRSVRVSLARATLTCEKKHLLLIRNEAREVQHVA
jgi:hypothetical protein